MIQGLSRIRQMIPFVPLALILSIVGCSGSEDSAQLKPAMVRGVVAFHGRPLIRGTVTFLPMDRGPGRIDPGIASIGPDGTFWVGNSNLSKPAGLQPGKYKVTILAMKPRPEGPSGPLAVLEVPERYTQESTTPIEVVIKAGQNRIRVDLVDDGVEQPSVQTEYSLEDPDSASSEKK